MARIDAFLKLGREQGCSDVHLAVGIPSMLRMNGDLMPIKFRQLSDTELETYVIEVLTAKQKERWLQPMIAGEMQTALAFAEPQGRYDVANILTTAKADGDGWVIDGKKSLVFNGGNADLLVVPARTSGGQSDTDGISLFAVPADDDGITVQAYPTVDGHHAADVELQSVRVGADVPRRGPVRTASHPRSGGTRRASERSGNR